MFRHKKLNKIKDTTEQGAGTLIDNEFKLEEEKKTALIASKENNDSLRALVEKNLKWSQIIYEQNRKINHKLLWTAIAGWLRLLLILVPLILAVIYLTPVVKDLMTKFDSLTGMFGAPAAGSSGSGKGGQGAAPAAMEDFLELFNLSPTQIEKLKGLLK